LGACLGPAALDLPRGTHTVAVPRYALAGLPAALVLVGLALSRLRSSVRAVFLTLIVLIWQIGIGRQYLEDVRCTDPTRQLGQLLAAQTGPSDLVIVHSIPSGVLGVARYLEDQGTFEEAVGFAPWVGQLRQRSVPESLHRLATGRRRIILVKIRDMGEPAPEEGWLREHATLSDVYKLRSASVLYFTPRESETFFGPGTGPLLAP
jgi:hypothetical protein